MLCVNAFFLVDDRGLPYINLLRPYNPWSRTKILHPYFEPPPSVAAAAGANCGLLSKALPGCGPVHASGGLHRRTHLCTPVRVPRGEGQGEGRLRCVIRFVSNISADFQAQSSLVSIVRSTVWVTIFFCNLLLHSFCVFCQLGHRLLAFRSS